MADALMPFDAMANAAVLEALDEYPQRVAHEGQHQRAVASVRHRLGWYEREAEKLRQQLQEKANALTQLEAEHAQLKAEHSQQRDTLHGAVRQLMFEGDLLVKSYGGSLCPARKDTLIAASQYFKNLLTLNYSSQQLEGQQVVSLEASREAVRALVLELHIPYCTDHSKITQALAFEVLDLVEMMRGPDPEAVPSAGEATDTSMRRVATLFTTAFVQNRQPGRLDEEEAVAFSHALMRAMQHAEGAVDSESWLTDAWRQVIATSARSLRLIKKLDQTSQHHEVSLAGLSPAALIKVLEADIPRGVRRRKTEWLIADWIVARGNQLPRCGAPLRLMLQVGSNGHIRARVTDMAVTARKRSNTLMKQVSYLFQAATGFLGGYWTPNELRSRCAELGLSAAGESEELSTRLIDFISQRWGNGIPYSRGCPAYNGDYARLWASMIDGIAVNSNVEKIIGSSERVESLDPMSFARLLGKSSLGVTAEAQVVKWFLRWAEVPGREVAIIDKIAPLVRFPLVCVCPPDPDIKAAFCRVFQRSAVVRDLVQEALALQQDVGKLPAGMQSGPSTPVIRMFQPAKHALMDGTDDVVQRHKRRKLCELDAVPKVSVIDMASAIMSLPF